MLLPLDFGPSLPPGPGARVNPEGAGRLSLGESKLSPLGYQPTGKRLLIGRLRVIAEERDKGWDEPNFGLPLSRLPVVNRPRIHSEECCCLLLGDGEHEPATADMVAQGLRLEVPFLLNQ